MLKDYSLNALRVFALAANATSFKHAAQQLGLSQSAVTRHIQTLEDQLGTSLFHRDNRVYALTPAGRVLARQLLPLFQQMQHAVQQTQLCGDEELTTLRIMVPDSLLRFWLAQRLTDFNALYPHIRLHVLTFADVYGASMDAQAQQDLQQGTVDVLVSAGKVKDRTLKQQRLYTPKFVPVAHPQSYDAAILTWFVATDSSLWKRAQGKLSHDSKQAAAQNASSSNLAIDLVSALPGFALADQLWLEHPQLQQLQRSADVTIDADTALYVSYKQSTHHPVSVVAFSKWLASRIEHALPKS
ncbi:LysR family transcriptional regulator [Pseudidiomarina salilacus]|uniref:LysR family transcriptional regulator n=1 Tax=Pseudidiomarina salilacus TaxID=3384452 RepID=UPI0039852B6E